MLILNDSDILRSIDFNELLKSVEEAFLLQEQGEYFMPDRMHMEYKGNTQLLMPAFAKDYFATKLVSLFPNNSKLNKPSLYGTVVLNDGHTGEPLALLNGSRLTALRTAAVGALGLAYTTPKNTESLGLAGAGIQGFNLVLLACAVRTIRRVAIFDPFHKDLSSFIGSLAAYLTDVELYEVKDAEELVKQSEAIITATTSNTAVIPDDAILTDGKHFIGIGSYRPGMQEYPTGMISRIEQIIIDTPLALKESGDLAIPLSKGLIQKEQIHTLGKLITGKINIDESKTTFFKSVGMALFDLLTAETIYKNARKYKIGQEVIF